VYYWTDDDNDWKHQADVHDDGSVMVGSGSESFEVESACQEGLCGGPQTSDCCSDSDCSMFNFFIM
jgi:hypothetical protein